VACGRVSTALLREELREWLPRIERLASQAEAVHLMFNTKVGDQGVQNAARLQALLGLS
jgi:uncharacterized protein YecE (DUF72 family)